MAHPGGAHEPALQRQAAGPGGKLPVDAASDDAWQLDPTAHPVRRNLRARPVVRRAAAASHPGDLGDKIEALATSAFVIAASS